MQRDYVDVAGTACRTKTLCSCAQTVGAGSRQKIGGLIRIQWVEGLRFGIKRQTGINRGNGITAAGGQLPELIKTSAVSLRRSCLGSA